MTEETKRRLPGIIERIDELRDEVEKIHEAEVRECQEKRDEMDRVAQLDADREDDRLCMAYAALNSAAYILTRD